MPLKYGDAVVLLQKRRDGTITQSNAFVLHSAVQPPNAHRQKALRNHQGVLAEGEYLDLMYLTPLPEGQMLKSRSADAICRFSSMTPPWDGDGVIGWEPKETQEEIDEYMEELDASHERELALGAELEALKAQGNTLDSTDQTSSV